MKERLKLSNNALILIIIQLGFVLSEQSAYLAAKSNLVLSANVVLFLNISKIIALFVGTALIIWLLTCRPFLSLWRDRFIFIFASFLVEYWYFAYKLLYYSLRRINT